MKMALVQRKVDDFPLKMSNLKMLQSEFSEFCSTTSIHGMVQIFDRKNGFVSQIVWILVVAASFVAAGFCIKESLDGKQIFNFNYN